MGAGGEGAGCRCGAKWTGMRIEHCPECHQTFTGTASGDKHRTGDHAVSTGPDRRRCRTVEEMREVGMDTNKRGQWTLGGNSPWGAGASAVPPRNAQHPSGGVPGRSGGHEGGSGR